MCDGEGGQGTYKMGTYNKGEKSVMEEQGRVLIRWVLIIKATKV